jgi:hypothetical protein
MKDIIAADRGGLWIRASLKLFIADPNAIAHRHAFLCMKKGLETECTIPNQAGGQWIQYTKTSTVSYRQS